MVFVIIYMYIYMVFVIIYMYIYMVFVIKSEIIFHL